MDVFPRVEAGSQAILADSGRVGAPSVLHLWVRIDEAGRVVDVHPATAAVPAHRVESLRVSLLATKFQPARKDGRPVRSRLLLSIGLDGAPGRVDTASEAPD